MPFYERQQSILDRLHKDGSVSVGELSEALFISKPTLRRDLDKLEKMGLIVRTHGGASLADRSADTRVPFLYRENEQNEAKTIIASHAAELIHDGDTIMLDGATSSYAVVPFLGRFHDLIVITNSAKSAFALGEMGISTICTGGRMITGSLAYVGQDAVRTVESYNADLLFFSCRGLSDDGQLTDSSVEENNLRRVMMNHARRRVLLCDSSKLGKRYLHNLCTLDELDDVICEKRLPDELAGLVRTKRDC